MVVFQQDGHDRVEGQPRCVGADLVEDLLTAVLVHGENRRRDLRHRLDAEFVVHVAHGHHVAVGQAGRDAEEVRRHVGQIGDIVGVLAARFVLAAFVGRSKGLLNRFFVDFLVVSHSLFCRLVIVRRGLVLRREHAALALPLASGRGRIRRRPAGLSTTACAGRRSRTGRLTTTTHPMTSTENQTVLLPVAIWLGGTKLQDEGQQCAAEAETSRGATSGRFSCPDGTGGACPSSCTAGRWLPRTSACT